MRRRDFHRGVIGLGLAAGAAIAGKGAEKSSSERPRRKATKADAKTRTEFLTEPARKLPIPENDVPAAGWRLFPGSGVVRMLLGGVSSAVG